jgi:chromosome segregation ATPase
MTRSFFRPEGHQDIEVAWRNIHNRLNGKKCFGRNIGAAKKYKWKGDIFLEKKLDIILGELNKLNERMETFEHDLKDMKSEMNRRFEEVDKRFVAVDRRFDHVDKKFEEVDKRFDHVDKRFAEVDKRFDHIEKRFEEIDKRFDFVDKRFEEVDRKFDHVDKRFEAVEDKLDAIANQVAANTEDIQELKERQKQIERAVLETNESVKQLKTIQDSQHRIIELLSARSLEQESELKELKRVQ